MTVATLGCEQVDTATAKLKIAWDKLRGRSTAQAPPPAPARPAPDTAAARLAEQQQQQQQAEAVRQGQEGQQGRQGQQAQPVSSRGPRPPSAPAGQALSRDVPYVSDDTGTVNPGMSEHEVDALWSSPAAVRRVGEYTYLFFRNGCEYTCGTMDIVTLKDGRVVDAVVRWDGHRYSGESSSPLGRVPIANPGGEKLRVTPPPAPPPPPPP
ncbi:MAG TPA: hypothetical protein VE714_08465, partial [Gemmatimonadales bacterium]|nr:hypothetical protein [Gemmatimonadales bacterium]